MDRKHFVVEKARELLGSRLEETLRLVRQDRGAMRGWEEPAHIRSVLRRSINEQNATPSQDGNLAVAVEEFVRNAGEPNPGQRRECLGQILESGASALEKMMSTPIPELCSSERLGLECVLTLYARPSLLLNNQGRLGAIPEMWNGLDEQREDIEMVQRGVGRLELMGHPEWDWAGTACLVNETTLMTTRRTAESFCEMQGQSWSFRPGITAWMDYRCETLHQASAGCRVRGVMGVHPVYDLALLDVEPSPQACPLVISSMPPSEMRGRPVYMISYPVCDSRRSESETINRIFRDVYGCKRVNPGRIANSFRFGSVELMSHDCCTLGQTTGGCVFDMETHQVVGLQLSSRYLDCGTCVPVSVLREDPLFTKCGVTFSSSNPAQLGMMTQQLERLSRTRYWPDLCRTIGDFYQKACPTP